MSNPFAPLEPLLHTLAEHGSVLPATGQAMVDLITPDLEEAFDRFIGDRDGNRSEKIFRPWETGRQRPRHREHRLRYFLDGWRESIFSALCWNMIVRVPCSSPRSELPPSTEEMTATEHRFLLLMDKQSLSEQLWDEVERAIAGATGF